MIVPIRLSNQNSFKRVAEIINSQGFAFIQTPPVIAPVISRIFKSGQDFFSLPITEKKRYTFRNLTAGYRCIGSEFSKSSERCDLLESFSYMPTEESVLENRLSRPAAFLHILLKNYACSIAPLIKRIVAQMAQIYGQALKQEDLFSAKYSPTQFNYYKPFAHRRHILVDPHEDGGILTALIVNYPGLEMYTGKREYVPIEGSYNTIILMAGETLALLTGYLIEPQQHRVRRYKDQKSRASLAYFANVNIDIDIHPWVTNEKNINVDIVEQAINNPTKYGLPPLHPSTNSE